MDQIRDAYLEELLSYREDDLLVFKQLIRQKDAAIDGFEDKDIKAGRKALSEVFRVHICMKKAGVGLEQFCCDLNNNYSKQVCQYLQEISKAHRQIEYFKPIFLAKKKIDSSKSDLVGSEVTGDQHLEDSGKYYPCFKCDYFKPDYIGAKQYKFKVKLDGTLLSTQKTINKKFEELKEAKSQASTNLTTIGMQLICEVMIVQSELGNLGILPTFNQVIQDKFSYDRHTA